MRSAWCSGPSALCTRRKGLTPRGRSDAIAIPDPTVVLSSQFTACAVYSEFFKFFIASRSALDPRK